MARDCQIKEIPSSGDKLSWAGVREVISNGVKENVWVQCRLDRAFGNSEWFSLFPRSHTIYLERLGSDHRPILTNIRGIESRRVGRFMYDKRWSQKLWSLYAKAGFLIQVMLALQSQNALQLAGRYFLNGNVLKLAIQRG